MSMLLYSAVILIAIFIFIQDFTERKVLWLLFPLLAVFGLLLNLKSFDMGEMLIHLTINFLLTAIQYLFLLIFIYLKKGKHFSLFNFIGLGDVLLSVSLCFIFEPTPFILFNISSLFFSLLLHFLFQLNHTYKVHKTVALAGWQALLLSFVLTVDLFYPVIESANYIVF